MYSISSVDINHGTEEMQNIVDKVLFAFLHQQLVCEKIEFKLFHGRFIYNNPSILFYLLFSYCYVCEKFARVRGLRLVLVEIKLQFLFSFVLSVIT